MPLCSIILIDKVTNAGQALTEFSYLRSLYYRTHENPKVKVKNWKNMRFNPCHPCCEAPIQDCCDVLHFYFCLVNVLDIDFGFLLLEDETNLLLEDGGLVELE